MPISLCSDTIFVEIFFDQTESCYEDNITLSFTEDCPENEKVFRVDETNILMTAEQARKLGQALLKAAEESADYADKHCGDSQSL
jgi:hypothetical protein